MPRPKVDLERVAHCLTGPKRDEPAGAWVDADDEIVCRACWEVVAADDVAVA